MSNGKITKSTSLTFFHGQRIIQGLWKHCSHIKSLPREVVLKADAIHQSCSRFKKQMNYVDGALKVHRNSKYQSAELKHMRSITRARFFHSWEMYFIQAEDVYRNIVAITYFKDYQKKVISL